VFAPLLAQSCYPLENVEEFSMPQVIHRTESPTMIPMTAAPGRPRGGQVPRELIAALAYELWEEAGRPGDRDMEFWLRAEAELQRRFAGTGH
jgi:hypothetical protein